MNSAQKERDWFSVCGESDLSLSERVASRIMQLEREGVCSASDQEHVRDLRFGAANGRFATSPRRLELLRRLCQIHSIEVQDRAITSHRKVIGPLIVLAKRAIFSTVRTLLGPTFKHQQDFNAVTVSLLMDLCNEAEQDGTGIRGELGVGSSTK